MMVRLGNLFRRRSTTEWSEREKRALKALWDADSFQASVDEVEAFYLLPETVFPMNGREKKREDYWRHDLVTLLNNWWAELGKARKFFETHPKLRPTATQANGTVQPSPEFLSYNKTTYPTAKLDIPLSRLQELAGSEFRAACPGMPLEIAA